MKNRKTVVVAFLLVAAMLMSVGYAALADDLLVNGTLNLSADAAQDTFEAEVYFSAVTKDTTGLGAADIIEIDSADTTNDTVTFTVNSLKVVGDKATFTWTIKNDNDFPVVATPRAATGVLADTTYFSISAVEAVEVGADATATVSVTVTLDAIPTNDVDYTTTYALTYDVAVKP